MQKKLAIIGANESITCLICKAKELGYETHVFAWECGDPGEKVADFFYPISVSEKDRILQKCKEIGICGICSITSDFAAPVVAYVARNLGLPGNPERTDLVARNKFEMRKAFTEYGGIYCPKFAEVDNGFDLSVVENFSFPVIVKPVDRWSSKGITRVDDIKQLKAAVEYAVCESLNHKAIVEEFMEGPEYSAECIVCNGEVTVLAFTKKETTGYPHYIETGHRQPSDISNEQISKITSVIKNAIKALDITNSAAHVEFRILDNGNVGIIEIGARMGGDCIGTHLVELSTGIDYIKMVIDVACGNRLDFSAHHLGKNAHIKFILQKEDLEEYDRISQSPDYSIVSESIERKSTFSTVTNSSDRHGYFVYTTEKC